MLDIGYSASICPSWSSIPPRHLTTDHHLRWLDASVSSLLGTRKPLAIGVMITGTQSLGTCHRHVVDFDFWNNDHIFQPFSGGMVFHLFFSFSITHILVSLFPLHLVYTHYCSPLLGGYGARTRGVYQHPTLNGIKTKTNNKTIVFYRPPSMPFALLPRCRHRRCCPFVDNA